MGTDLDFSLSLCSLSLSLSLGGGFMGHSMFGGQENNCSQSSLPTLFETGSLLLPLHVPGWLVHECPDYLPLPPIFW